jgi:hypothetical protein
MQMILSTVWNQKKLLILLNCPKILGIEDYEIEVEYQAETIGNTI